MKLRQQSHVRRGNVKREADDDEDDENNDLNKIKAEPGSDSDAEYQVKSEAESEPDVSASKDDGTSVDVKKGHTENSEPRLKQHPKSKPKTVPTGNPKSEANLKPPNPPLDTPSLRDPALNYSYAIARGEMGVLSFEPYKSLVLPYWRFRTVPIAQNSSKVLWAIFESYVERKDLVGADMTRKYIQMGMTRAKRYANHKGGRKYGKDGKQLEKWSGEDVDGKRREKEEASEVFKAVWRRCIECDAYLALKESWTREKKKYLKDHDGS